MKISSPIPHILSVLALRFKDENNTKKCLDLLAEIETSNVETNSRILDDAFKSFIKLLDKDKALAYRTSAFASSYFTIIGERDLGETYANLLHELFTEKKISDFHAGYIAGLFTTAIMNDLGLNSLIYNNKNLPKNIEDAIKYIESEGFSVYVK